MPLARLRTTLRAAAWSPLAVLAGWAAADAEGTRFCESDAVLLDSHFPGGAFATCSVQADGTFTVTVRAEDAKVVVPMPWYAFRASPKRAGSVAVAVEFVDSEARFWPKISPDGTAWRRMDAAAITSDDDGRRLTLRIELQEAPMWIAAQRLLTGRYYDAWTRHLAARADVRVRTIGRSMQGRPVVVAETQPRAAAVVLLGRQHPPEVTGALTLRGFADRVLGDSALAQAFRARYAVILAPLLNPDGVAAGHWRHNAGETDLNRDWGPFTQSETQSVARLLDQLGAAPRLMLDFHSTKFTTSYLFYTQRPEDGDGTAHRFAAHWLARARSQLPDVDFIHRPSRSESHNAKNYFFARYGIPSITFETGDETHVEGIAAAAPVFADEMMKALLELDGAPRPGAAEEQ